MRPATWSLNWSRTTLGNQVPTDPSRVTPLDGMRAVAVTAVILYHAEPTWAIGGYFGVDVFFVLSGYLITSLLLREWQRTGGIALRAFWGRRARRLLPALFLMLAVVGLVAVLWPQVLGSPSLVADTVATMGYVANWHLLAAHTGYFATVTNPSALLPTWSLAIEEQFYLVWPVVLLILVGALHRRHRQRTREDDGASSVAVVAVVAIVAAAASALLMALLTPIGSDSVNRSYYGSDTRAQGLLVGAALAALCLWWGPVRTMRGRRALSVLGITGGVGIVVMFRAVAETSVLTFHGGFALLALGTAALIACVSLIPDHPFATALSFQPLPYLGQISYGMYLWYWPVLLLFTSERTHLSGLSLLVCRMVIVVAIASASFHLIETPIRRGALARWRSWVAVSMAAVLVPLLPLVVPTLATQSSTAQAAGSPQHVAEAALPYSAASASPVRILIVGDSMAGSLGVGLSSLAPHYDAEIINKGSPGCSLAMGSLVRVLWYTIPPGGPCEAADPEAVLNAYRSLVRRFDPDVVVYLARGDTLGTERDGSWQHLGEPNFDRWAQARYEQAIAVLSSEGAHVVLLTTPYYKGGEQSDGQPLPENDPSRVTIENHLLDQAVAHDPQGASVFDLGTMLSPSGQFSTDINGVAARCADGVHVTVSGGQWIGRRLLPRLVSEGRSHAVASLQIGRPQFEPQSSPPWYVKLPCST
jgi:peptidoglycan/LPS O-acetylase OafA/YrhL